MLDYKVSIITVSLNSEKTISKTIESVLNQSYSNIEYIILDGLSKDKTIKIAESYRDAFVEKNITYTIVSEKDDGIFFAMNKGIAMASGEIVGIINSDDWYELDAIKNMVNVYENIGFDVFYADLRLIRDKGEIIKRVRIRNFMTSRDWNHPTTFVKKSVYDEKGMLRAEDPYADLDLILRLKKRGCKFIILNEVLANFRYGGVSTSIKFRDILKYAVARYRTYRYNGYSWLYFFECLLAEAGRHIVAR